MDFFEYKNGELCAEDVPVERIAKEVGTPAYIYSLATLRRHFRVFDQAFKNQSHLVCFSVKANSNLAVLKVFVNEGGGFDIVSGGSSSASSKRAPILKSLSSRAWERAEANSSMP